MRGTPGSRPAPGTRPRGPFGVRRRAAGGSARRVVLRDGGAAPAEQRLSRACGPALRRSAYGAHVAVPLRAAGGLLRRLERRRRAAREGVPTNRRSVRGIPEALTDSRQDRKSVV